MIEFNFGEVMIKFNFPEQPNPSDVQAEINRLKQDLADADLVTDYRGDVIMKLEDDVEALKVHLAAVKERERILREAIADHLGFCESYVLRGAIDRAQAVK